MRTKVGITLKQTKKKWIRLGGGLLLVLQVAFYSDDR
jgi:hypothetical protein